MAEVRRCGFQRSSAFEREEFVIRRFGKKVIRKPNKRRRWPRGYWKSWRSVPEDFVARNPLPASRPRVELDKR